LNAFIITIVAAFLTSVLNSSIQYPISVQNKISTKPEVSLYFQ
jgi:hypothetical protein